MAAEGEQAMQPERQNDRPTDRQVVSSLRGSEKLNDILFLW